MTRLTRVAAATATLLVLAACSGDPAPSAVPPTPTGIAASASPSVAPAAAGGPLTPGQLFTFDNRAMTTTVLRYKQPVAEGSGLKKGEVLGGIEVRTCVLAHADTAPPVSVTPWSLEWADGTTNDYKWSGVVSSEYPYNFKTVTPGKCVKGWIVFTVPEKSKPTLAFYEGDANRGRPAEWKLS